MHGLPASEVIIPPHSGFTKHPLGKKVTPVQHQENLEGARQQSGGRPHDPTPHGLYRDDDAREEVIQIHTDLPYRVKKKKVEGKAHRTRYENCERLEGNALETSQKKIHFSILKVLVSFICIA
jgi:hypothetical protein